MHASEKYASEMQQLENSSDVSDTMCNTCGARHCPLVSNRKRDDWIQCESCDSGTTGHAPDLGTRSLFHMILSVTCVPFDALYCVNARKQ